MANRTADLRQTTSLLQALAEPTRLRIVDLLRGGERCVCELTDALDADQPRLSFHLRVLKEAGLVSDRRKGRWVYYTLSRDKLAGVAEFLTMPGTAWNVPGKCCD